MQAEFKFIPGSGGRGPETREGRANVSFAVPMPAANLPCSRVSSHTRKAQLWQNALDEQSEAGAALQSPANLSPTQRADGNPVGDRAAGTPSQAERPVLDAMSNAAGTSVPSQAGAAVFQVRGGIHRNESAVLIAGVQSAPGDKGMVELGSTADGQKGKRITTALGKPLASSTQLVARHNMLFPLPPSASAMTHDSAMVAMPRESSALPAADATNSKLATAQVRMVHAAAVGFDAQPAGNDNIVLESGGSCDGPRTAMPGAVNEGILAKGAYQQETSPPSGIAAAEVAGARSPAPALTAPADGLPWERSSTPSSSTLEAGGESVSALREQPQGPLPNPLARQLRVAAVASGTGPRQPASAPLSPGLMDTMNTVNLPSSTQLPLRLASMPGQNATSGPPSPGSQQVMQSGNSNGQSLPGHASAQIMASADTLIRPQEMGRTAVTGEIPAALRKEGGADKLTGGISSAAATGSPPLDAVVNAQGETSPSLTTAVPVAFNITLPGERFNPQTGQSGVQEGKATLDLATPMHLLAMGASGPRIASAIVTTANLDGVGGQIEVRAVRTAVGVEATLRIEPGADLNGGTDGRGARQVVGQTVGPAGELAAGQLAGHLIAQTGGPEARDELGVAGATVAGLKEYLTAHQTPVVALHLERAPGTGMESGPGGGMGNPGGEMGGRHGGRDWSRSMDQTPEGTPGSVIARQPVHGPPIDSVAPAGRILSVMA